MKQGSIPRVTLTGRGGASRRTASGMESNSAGHMNTLRRRWKAWRQVSNPEHPGITVMPIEDLVSFALAVGWLISLPEA